MENQNMPKDLISAKDLIGGEGCLIALVCGDEKIVSSKRGISFLLELAASGENFEGYVVADKIVGKAAALMFAYLQVKCIYAEVLSEKAIPILKKYKIEYFYGKKVEYIINRTNTGLCPMEETVLNCDDPNDARTLLEKKVASLKSNK